MFKMSRRAIVVAVVCVFALSLAAYAQTRQKTWRAGDRPRVSAQAVPQGAGVPGRQGQFCRLASVQRILMPLNVRELERLAMALGLTEEQKAKLKELHIRFRDAVKPVLDERGPAVRQLINAIQEPSPSKGRLQSLSEPILRADRAILDAEFDYWLGFRNILSGEQQAKFGQFMQQRALGGMRPGGPGGPPPAP